MSTKVKPESCYHHALKLLRSRRRPRRPPSLDRIPQSDTSAAAHSNLPKNDVRGKASRDGMREWLHQIGHSDKIIDNMRIIHVAGTKGKGSTCAFSEALLGALKKRTGFPETYGLYTSPPLHEEKERIRINSQQITSAKFAERALEVWDALKLDSAPTDRPPRFLQLMFLICLHTFIKEGVRVAVVETHHGGQFDSTNIFRDSVVTGVTSLGMDHVDQLGPGIEDIAWHKSGIFKKGQPAFTLEEQPEGVHEVMKRRATELQTELRYVSENKHLPLDHPILSPGVQRLNLSMALALVQSHLNHHTTDHSITLTEKDIRQALDDVHLPGRFQRLKLDNIEWFLDGAHNSMSIDKPIVWFADVSREGASRVPVTNNSSVSNPFRILIFSQISSERDGEEVVTSLTQYVNESGLSFDHVMFCFDGTREDGSLKLDRNFGHSDMHHKYAEMWREAGLPGVVSNVSTIAEAYSYVKSIGIQNEHVQVLATGSFHLVGGLLASIKQ